MPGPTPKKLGDLGVGEIFRGGGGVLLYNVNAILSGSVVSKQIELFLSIFYVSNEFKMMIYDDDDEVII